jgi:Domain of unknown function (DUF4410)
MRIAAFVSFALLIALCGISTVAQEENKPPIAATASVTPRSTEAAGVADRATVVYVSDFELEVPSGSTEKNSAGAKTAPTNTFAPIVPVEGKEQPNAKRDDGPTEQAARIVDFMSVALVKELQKVGYTARRMRPGDARPQEGIGIKGVFAVPDAENHLRRAVVGAGSSVGKVDLFVGIGNLARPDQPLYVVVDPKVANLDPKSAENSEKEPGAIIAVSAYAPVAKFEMPKNLTEKNVKDTAAAIVADLTQLLNSNVAALAH